MNFSQTMRKLQRPQTKSNKNNILAYSVLAIDNFISFFLQSINITYYRLCVKEIHKPNGYDPVKVTTLIIGEN